MAEIDINEGLKALRESIARLTRRPVVLIVEDETRSANLIEAQLRSMCECEIIIALTGDSACTVLAQQDVDVIFLDLRLPGKSGVDVMLQMSEVERKKTIIVTGLFEEAEEIKEAIRLGAVRVLTKPVKLEDLKAVFSRPI